MDHRKMELAKILITDFCRKEYDSTADFSDPKKVDLAYTTSEDGVHEIQVSVNLVEFQMETYIDGVLTKCEKYKSLKDLIENELVCLDFCTLISI